MLEAHPARTYTPPVAPARTATTAAYGPAFLHHRRDEPDLPVLLRALPEPVGPRRRAHPGHLRLHQHAPPARPRAAPRLPGPGHGRQGRGGLPPADRRRLQGPPPGPARG